MKYDMRGCLWRIYLATGTAAVIGIVRTRTAGRDRVSWIDATIVATGFGLLSWYF